MNTDRAIPGETHDEDVGVRVERADAEVSDADVITAQEVALRVAKARNLSPEDCDDLAQTVAEKLLRQKQLPDNVAAWANTVAKHAIIDLDRKRKARDEADNWVAREVGFDAEQADAVLGVAMFLQQQRSASDQGMQRQSNEEMMALLRTVLSEQHIQLMLLLGEGRSHADIAKELGYKNADSVKATINRLRGKLAAIADRLAEFRHHPRVY